MSRGLLRDYEPSDGTFSSTSLHTFCLHANGISAALLQPNLIFSDALIEGLEAGRGSHCSWKCCCVSDDSDKLSLKVLFADFSALDHISFLHEWNLQFDRANEI